MRAASNESSSSSSMSNAGSLHCGEVESCCCSVDVELCPEGGESRFCEGWWGHDDDGICRSFMGEVKEASNICSSDKISDACTPDKTSASDASTSDKTREIESIVWLEFTSWNRPLFSFIAVEIITI